MEPLEFAVKLKRLIVQSRDASLFSFTYVDGYGSLQSSRERSTVKYTTGFPRQLRHFYGGTSRTSCRICMSLERLASLINVDFPAVAQHFRISSISRIKSRVAEHFGRRTTFYFAAKRKRAYFTAEPINFGTLTIQARSNLFLLNSSLAFTRVSKSYPKKIKRSVSRVKREIITIIGCLRDHNA